MDQDAPGLLAGSAGVAVMTLGEKAEQQLPGWPGSHGPARTLERVAGMPERPGRQPLPVNRAMRYGQRALLGALRSVMAHAGLRGPWPSAQFTVIRLTNDQILENVTGVGATPQSWPLAVGPGQDNGTPRGNEVVMRTPGRCRAGKPTHNDSEPVCLAPEHRQGYRARLGRGGRAVACRVVRLPRSAAFA
ncbi:hypothetical protein [Streptomyces sp. NPDC051452]|uniref:hypothetical protein n=1 Tax=Streptomyces sp. NPDC051452 TaxID=3365654 RepID=UPI003788CA7A